MTGPSTGSLTSNLTASGDGLCRADTRNSARRRCRASPRSISANSASSGASSTKPRPRRVSAVRCWCAPSPTGCRKSPRVGRVWSLQRQLRQIALELQQTGRVRIYPRLKPGTRLMREWRGRSHEVQVLDDGFSWQGTHYRSLSAIARKITGTAWSGPLFFGLRSNRSGTRSPSQASVSVDQPMEADNAVG